MAADGVSNSKYARAWLAYVRRERADGSNPVVAFAVDCMDELGPFSSVLDIGCGAGDLAIEMKARGMRPDRYLGIDADSDLLAHCRSLDIPNAEFKQLNLADPTQAEQLAGNNFDADVIVGVRILNNLDDDTVRRLLTVLKSARAGRRYVFLNPYVTEPEGDDASADPFTSREVDEHFEGAVARHFERTARQYASMLKQLEYASVATATATFREGGRPSHSVVYGVI